MAFLKNFAPENIAKARKMLYDQAEANRRKAMQELGSSQSLFAEDLPTDIGRIIMVDSLRWGDGVLTVWQRLKQSALVLLIVTVIALPIAYLSFHNNPNSTILTVITLAICLVVSLVILALTVWKAPAGTDYFLGEQGCAIVNYTGRRSNITSRWVYQYRDYNIFLLSELWQGPQANASQEEPILGTKHVLFETGFFNIFISNRDDLHASAGFDMGTHLRWHEGDIIAEPQFHFWNGVEEQWTRLQLERMGDDLQHMGVVTFYEFRLPPDTPRVAQNASRRYHATPRITFDGEAIRYGNRFFTRYDLTRVFRQVGIDTNYLVLQSGDEQVRVPLAYLGNRLLLIRLLERWLGTAIGYADA